jgi:hypothetical protein
LDRFRGIWPQKKAFLLSAIDSSNYLTPSNRKLFARTAQSRQP